MLTTHDFECGQITEHDTEKLTTLARPRVNDNVEDDLGTIDERRLNEKIMPRQPLLIF